MPIRPIWTPEMPNFKQFNPPPPPPQKKKTTTKNKQEKKPTKTTSLNAQLRILKKFGPTLYRKLSSLFNNWTDCFFSQSN